MSSKTTPLAIVGISCLFPKADDLQAYWANIKNGVDAITAVPIDSHWNAADYFDADPKSADRTYAASGGFLSPVNFNPMEFGIAPKDIEATDTSQLLSLIAAQRALSDAGYGLDGDNGRTFDKARTSVILGVTGALELVIPLGARLGHPIWRKALKDAGVEGTVAEDVVQRISDSYVGWQENSFPGLLGNVAAGRIASRLDLGGTNCVVDAACASSLAAIHLAGLELAAGRSDMVITGGVDTFNDIFMYMCFSKTPALSPTGHAKPFDRDCDGTVLGEGLGLLVVKRLADAERDGDRIYAVIKGIGSSSDGRSSAIYAPRAGGQKLALQRAYDDAEAAPQTIGLIEAHGTGTKVGDATELSALIEVFQTDGESTPWCALGSVKSQIGHTKAAAGVAGIIKAAMALHEKVLPPTIKINQPLDEAAARHSPFYLNTHKRPWLPAAGHPRRAGVSALGFGGTNFHCVLEEHASAKPGVDWAGDVEILAFQAETLAALRTQLATQPGDGAWLDVRRAAHASRQGFRQDAAFRLLMVVTPDSDRASLQQTALRMLEKNPEQTSWTAPAGIAFGSGKKHGKLGALFPGQGSQYPGMLRDLACQFPGMMNALAEADAVFARENTEHGGRRLSDFIYPHPVFAEDARQGQQDALKATDIAQPALGAVSMGAFNVLEYFGVSAQAACGHSYGELLALCGAGRIDSTTLHQLSNLRGRLMASGGSNGERGAMLAVQADEAAVQAFLHDENGPLVVANRNSPKQYVLSGPVEHIKRAVGNLTKRAIRSRMLQVSAAFHSPLVADAQAPFAQALESVAIDKGRMPVYANATGSAYPKSARQAREVLANQIVRPVNFMQQVLAMHAEDVRTFIEIGPGHVLGDLVQSILPGGVVETIALDTSKGKRSGSFDLALALARLASLGHEVALTKWENAPAAIGTKQGKPAFSVPLSGANYRAPTTARPPVVPRATPAQERLPAGPQGARVETRTPAATPAASVALRATQEGILALQRLQEQTAQLHKQFLEGQESARRSIQSLLEQRGGAMPPQISAPVPTSLVAAPAPMQPAVERPLPTPVPGPSTDRRHYEHAVLEVVCEKTGYPVEMLNLEMGMDSDLGIDSIKRVEIMAALRTRLPDAPEIKPEHLGTLQTLEQVVAFLADGTGGQAAAGSSTPSTLGTAAQTSVAPTRIRDAMLAVVAEKTGYPVEMLDLSMGMDSDLGIDSIKRVEIMAALRVALPSAPEVKPEHLGSLQTLQQVVDFLMAGSAIGPEEAPSASSAHPAPHGTDASRAADALLMVVAEKTGYPVEMLNLDMGMDSDLGIDSIKRVEIMAALRAALPDSPEIKPEHLGALHTLQQVVDFLVGAAAVGATAPVGAPIATSVATGDDTSRVSTALLAVVAEKTGYPVDMLDLAMGMDSDLGIDSIKRVEIMAALRTALPDAPEIKPEQLGTLQTLQQVVDFLLAPGAIPAPVPALTPITAAPRQAAPSAFPRSSVGVVRQIVGPVALPREDHRAPIELPVGAQVWLVDDGSALCQRVEERLRARRLIVHRGALRQGFAGSATDALAALVILAPAAGSDDDFLRHAFHLMQSAGPALRKAGKSGAAVLATVSRLDGAFGFGDSNAIADPISGGLAGLVKTAGREWPDVHCKAIDLDTGSLDPAATAAQIVAELFRVGPDEVGLSVDARVKLEVRAAERGANGQRPALSATDVVVVSGGARGVTSDAVLALAHAYRPTLILLGRSAIGESEPPWLQDLQTESGIKKAMFERRRGASPKEIEAACRDVLAGREIRTQLGRLQATGAKVFYHPVDVRDGAAVTRTLSELRQRHGAIHGLIHGAGVLADRRIEDKSAEQFDLVYGTKVTGLRNLLAALAQEDLKLIALFSSYSARFGRIGQADYAAANEVLNKLAQYESRRRPDCRVISFNWGPWNGGMATPEIRKIFAQEGIGLIEPEAGADFFVRELCGADRGAVEVLAIAPFDDDEAPGAGPPTPRVPESVAFSREVSVGALPFLESHVFNGRAVLPAALMVEWLAQAALHGNPGMAFHGLDNFKVLKGVVLEARQSISVSLCTAAARPQDALHLVPVRMTSLRDGREILHAQADVLLTTEKLPRAPAAAVVDIPGGGFADPYALGVLFHGVALQGIERVEAIAERGVAALLKAASAPIKWMTHPLRGTWIADPLALDSAFQMMILWSTAHRGAPSLPSALRSYRQFVSVFPKGGSRAVVAVAIGISAIATATIQFFDRQGNLLASAEGCEFVMDAALHEAFRLNRLGLEK